MQDLSGLRTYKSDLRRLARIETAILDVTEGDTDWLPDGALEGTGLTLLASLEACRQEIARFLDLRKPLPRSGTDPIVKDAGNVPKENLEAR